MVQEFDFAGFQVVSPGNDLEVPGLHSFGQDWLSLLQLPGNIECLGAYGVFDWIAGLTLRLLYSGLDGVQHGVDVTR